MHDYQECIDFAWAKFKDGTLLEWIDNNRLCALHKGSCITAGVTSPFCHDDEHDNDSVPDVIGSSAPSEGFLAKVQELDTELCSEQPEQQEIAAAASSAKGLDPATIAAILRIAQFILERVWKK